MPRHLTPLRGFTNPLANQLQFEYDRIEAKAREEYGDEIDLMWTGRVVVEDGLVFFETAATDHQPNGWMTDGGAEPHGFTIIWTEDLDELRRDAYPNIPRHLADGE